MLDKYSWWFSCRFCNPASGNEKGSVENKVGYTRRNLLVPLPLLAEIVRDGNDDLCDEALRLASQQGLADTESIRQCYYFIFRPEFHPQPLQLVQKTPGLADYQPDLSAYDALSPATQVGKGAAA